MFWENQTTLRRQVITSAHEEESYISKLASLCEKQATWRENSMPLLVSEPIIYISAWRIIFYIFSFLQQDSDFCEGEWAYWGKTEVDIFYIYLDGGETFP